MTILEMRVWNDQFRNGYREIGSLEWPFSATVGRTNIKLVGIYLTDFILPPQTELSSATSVRLGSTLMLKYDPQE